jgi:uncharacterized protein (DUF488 family)
MARIHTVGHSDRPIGAFLELLQAAGIASLVDVRRWPASRRHPWFDGRALDASLAAAGIRYLWLGEGLGGLREPTTPIERSPNRALRDPALRAYADGFEGPAFLAALARLEREARSAATAVMCAERDWRRCHRQLLADLLEARGCQVIHWLDRERREPHLASPWSRVAAGRVTYPGLL